MNWPLKFFKPSPKAYLDILLLTTKLLCLSERNGWTFIGEYTLFWITYFSIASYLLEKSIITISIFIQGVLEYLQREVRMSSQVKLLRLSLISVHCLELKKDIRITLVQDLTHTTQLVSLQSNKRHLSTSDINCIRYAYIRVCFLAIASHLVSVTSVLKTSEMQYDLPYPV